MIQRKQTLWLLLSIICAALTFPFAFYHGVLAKTGAGVEGGELTATDNIWLTALTAIVIISAGAAIFLFTNRKLQLKVTYTGLALSIILIGLYIYFMQFFKTGSIALTALFTLGFVAGFLLAIRGIKADEKLIRDLNRLR